MAKTTIQEVELIYRPKQTKEPKTYITDAVIAYETFLGSWNLNKIELVEEFKIMLLRHDNSVIGISHVATGGVSSCIVDPKIIFVTALKANASQIILAHNHPSGNLRASANDILSTQQTIDGGKLLEVKVLDHLIVTSKGFLSLTNEGLLPF